jgi:hypothetical protein
MSGKLLEAARKDALNFITSGGFEEDIILTHPSGSPVLNLKGLHSKHWIGFDSDGSQINSKNAHILISEKVLVDSLYVTRNLKTGNIDLLKHRITVKDSTLIEKEYVILECYPSETFGLIVCVLGDYKL